METLTKAEQVRVEALRFIARINQGVNPTPNGFTKLLKDVQAVEYYIKWGRTE